MKSHKYSQELVSECVAQVQEGKTPYAVAKAHGIPLSTVRSWAQNAGAAIIGANKREDAEDRGVRLLGKYLDAIEAGLDAYREREWWLKQDADKAGILLGILSDKVFVILGASQRADRYRGTEEFPAQPVLDSGAVRPSDQSEIPTS